MSKYERVAVYGGIIGLVFAVGVEVVFGIFRIHEGTWLCNYMLCLQGG